MREKQYTLKKFEHILDNNGFVKARSRGNHVTYKKEDKMITLDEIILKNIPNDLDVIKYKILDKRDD